MIFRRRAWRDGGTLQEGKHSGQASFGWSKKGHWEGSTVLSMTQRTMLGRNTTKSEHLWRDSEKCSNRIDSRALGPTLKENRASGNLSLRHSHKESAQRRLVAKSQVSHAFSTNVRTDIHHPVTGSGVAVARSYVECHRKLCGTPSCVDIHIIPSLGFWLNTPLSRFESSNQMSHNGNFSVSIADMQHLEKTIRGDRSRSFVKTDYILLQNNSHQTWDHEFTHLSNIQIDMCRNRRQR